MSLIGKKMLSLFNKSGKRPKSQAIISYEQAQKIGIIYTYEDEKKEEAIQHIVNLINNEKVVYVLCYMDKKEVASSINPTFRVDQISSWGKINSEEASHFLNSPFDFLIHLDFDLNEIMKNMLIHTKAKCRVGFHSETGNDFYELMIGMNKSAGTSNFAEQILKYIKAIR